MRVRKQRCEIFFFALNFAFQIQILSDHPIKTNLGNGL